MELLGPNNQNLPKIILVFAEVSLFFKFNGIIVSHRCVTFRKILKVVHSAILELAVTKDLVITSLSV